MIFTLNSRLPYCIWLWVFETKGLSEESCSAARYLRWLWGRCATNSEIIWYHSATRTTFFLPYDRDMHATISWINTCTKIMNGARKNAVCPNHRMRWHGKSIDAMILCAYVIFKWVQYPHIWRGRSKKDGIFSREHHVKLWNLGSSLVMIGNRQSTSQ